MRMGGFGCGFMPRFNIGHHGGPQGHHGHHGHNMHWGMHFGRRHHLNRDVFTPRHHMPPCGGGFARFFSPIGRFFASLGSPFIR